MYVLGRYRGEVSTHPNNEVTIPPVITGVEEGANEEATVLVLVNYNDIAHLRE